MAVISDFMTALLAKVIGVKKEGITKLQNEKIANIAIPTAWHVKFGKLKWLDEGLGKRIIVLEKNIEQKASSEDMARKFSSDEPRSETCKKASKNRQLYRIALYHGRLLTNENNKEIIGQTLVLFFRPSNRISRQLSFRECRNSTKEFSLKYREYSNCFFSLEDITDHNPPFVSFINRLDVFSEISSEFERIAALADGGAPLLWSEYQERVEIPVGCFPKQLTSMVLNYFLNNKEISEEEHEYLLSIVAEEELSPEQQKMFELVKKNFRLALKSDQESDWYKLKENIFKYHTISLKRYPLSKFIHKRDFSILAYYIACDIEKFAPKRIKYACEILMGGEFSSATEKRIYVNKYLKSFLNLMTRAVDSVSSNEMASLRIILSYSCGFYELHSDDRDPFQNFAAIQCTDREYLKNIFVTLLKMTRKLRKNSIVKTTAIPAKEVMTLESHPIAVADIWGEDKEKAERSFALPRGLSIVCGDLQKVDKEFLLLKREIASVSPEVQSSAMYRKHHKHQVLYIGFSNPKYDYIPDKDLIEPDQHFNENFFQTVLFILGDPEKSSIPRKSIGSNVYGSGLHNYHVIFDIIHHFRKYEFSSEKLEDRIKDVLNTGLTPEDPAHPDPYQDLQHFSFQIGRMPKQLCKHLFEFLITREVMPAEYLDFLMQFTTGHELSYRQSAVNYIHQCVSNQKYSRAVEEARVVTLDILEKTKAKESRGKLPTIG